MIFKHIIKINILNNFFLCIMYIIDLNFLFIIIIIIIIIYIIFANSTNYYYITITVAYICIYP